MAFLLAGSGCVIEDDALAIGRFEVQAELTADCGQATLLAAPTSYRTFVFLRRSGSANMLWDEGVEQRAIYRLDAGGSFEGTNTPVQVDLRNEPDDLTPYGLDPDDFPLDGRAYDDALPPDDDASGPRCIIRRTNTIEGQLDPAVGVARTVPGFTGTLSSRYEATEESDCSEFLALPVPLADQLPCTITYALDGKRQR
ncbi:MAG: hypothetical protein AAGA56_05065 [Myxococcota bacterium]